MIGSTALGTRWLTSGLVVAAIVGGLRAEEPTPTSYLEVAGGDRNLWLMSGEWDREQQHFLNWIAWMDSTSLAMEPLRRPPQLGRVRRCAESDGTLYLFVTVGSPGATTTGHYSYSRPRETRRERLLPNGAVPIALAGGSKESAGLWAVVDGKTAEQVRGEWEEYQRSLATQPAEHGNAARERGRSGSAPSVSSRPAGVPDEGVFLVAYDGIRWQPGFEGPGGIQDPARVWLTVSGEQYYVFWQASAEDRTIQCAQRKKGETEAWRSMPSVRFDRPVAEGFSGVLNKQLVFAALVEDASGAQLVCESRVLAPSGRDWMKQPALQQADGKPVLVPKGSVVGGLRDMLAVLRPAESGPEVGLWLATDGRAVLPFTSAPVRRSDASSGEPGRLQEMAYLLVVLAIIMLVYWRRRDSISSPAMLPAGMAAADFGRRGLAALLDMAPAAIVVGLIWRAPLAAYMSAVEVAVAEGQNSTPPLSNELMWAWLCFAFLYSAWCAGFELFLSVTPGKRLLGCSVVSEMAERPTKVQIVVRNTSRLVELLPQLMVWPFVLLIFMTRNRQRLGDLLARTVVVERSGETERDKDAEENARGRRRVERDDEE